MPKMKMSELCKMSMVEQFGFKNSELVQIENFINNQNQKTAKDILDTLMYDKKLNNKQKIVVAYVIGNSAREAAIQEELQKGIRIDMSGGVPPIGG
jgi:hypothetical protein